MEPRGFSFYGSAIITSTVNLTSSGACEFWLKIIKFANILIGYRKKSEANGQKWFRFSESAQKTDLETSCQ